MRYKILSVIITAVMIFTVPTVAFASDISASEDVQSENDLIVDENEQISDDTGVESDVEAADEELPADSAEIEEEAADLSLAADVSEKYTGPAPTFPNAIAQKAVKVAWPWKTDSSLYTYNSTNPPKPTPEYIKARNTAYGNSYKNWSKRCRYGASCDVFVGCVVACCYDAKFPRNLNRQIDYLPGNKFTKLRIYNISDFKPGDIILYKRKNGGGHISIYVELAGTGYIAEASHQNLRYGHISRKATSYNPNNFSSFAVYRAKNLCIGAIQRGDYFIGVQKLQLFLNWAGYDCGDADGDFGEKTENAVKAFQEAEGLEVDGKFGTKSYQAARKYTNWGDPKADSGKAIPIIVKKGYTGKWPVKKIRYRCKYKTDVKRWQSFLKWYGYPVKPTGNYGKKTLKYTKKFQKAKGVKASGIVGKTTLAKARKVQK